MGRHLHGSHRVWKVSCTDTVYLEIEQKRDFEIVLISITFFSGIDKPCWRAGHGVIVVVQVSGTQGFLW